MKIFYLSPTYYEYRVKVFEELNNLCNGNITVISAYLSTHRIKNPFENKSIIKNERYKTIKLKSIRLFLTKNFEKGAGTPSSVIITPSLFFVLLREKPDIIISNNFNTWTLSSVLLGFKTIVFWEGTEFTERTISKLKYFLRNYLAKRIDGFVTNGTLSMEYLIKILNVSPEKITVGGLCHTSYTNSQIIKRVSNNQKINFLFVGRLTIGKGLYQLLEACKELLKISNNFYLTIVGKGSEEKKLKQFVNENKLTGYVLFEGFKDVEQIWDYYCNSDVFILPTLQDNWPLVVPEAMEAAMPILLSKNAGSYPDLVLDGENGYVFNPFDIQKIAELMLIYIKEPEKIRLHGSKSRTIIENYTPKKAAEAFYKQICSVSK